jgi:hypothetical protein
MIIFFVCGEVNNSFAMIVAEYRMSRARKKALEEKNQEQAEIPGEPVVAIAAENRHERKTYKLKRRKRIRW